MEKQRKKSKKHLKKEESCPSLEIIPSNENNSKNFNSVRKLSGNLLHYFKYVY